MIDVKKLIRQAFFQLLEGNLRDPFNAIVHVYDDVQRLEDTTNLYVIMETQTGTPTNNFAQFASKEDILLSIVQKAPGRVARSQVDLIASQIFSAVLPHPNTMNGLPAQPGVLFLNVQLAQDAYQDFFLQQNTAVTRRLITFVIDCYQTNP